MIVYTIIGQEAQCASQVARHAKSTGDRGVRVAVATALQRQRGGGFDRLTKTRTAAKLLQVMYIYRLDDTAVHAQTLASKALLLPVLPAG